MRTGPKPGPLSATLGQTTTATNVQATPPPSSYGLNAAQQHRLSNSVYGRIESTNNQVIKSLLILNILNSCRKKEFLGTTSMGTYLGSWSSELCGEWIFFHWNNRQKVSCSVCISGRDTSSWTCVQLFSSSHPLDIGYGWTLHSQFQWGRQVHGEQTELTKCSVLLITFGRKEGRKEFLEWIPSGWSSSQGRQAGRHALYLRLNHLRSRLMVVVAYHLYQLIMNRKWIWLSLVVCVLRMEVLCNNI